jgi:hypothetical protein
VTVVEEAIKDGGGDGGVTIEDGYEVGGINEKNPTLTLLRLFQGKPLSKRVW